MEWLLEKPSNPSQWDEEFETDDLDPKWSLTPLDAGVTRVSYVDPTTTIGSGNPNRVTFRNRRGWMTRQNAANFGALGLSQGIQQDLIGLPNECFIVMRAFNSTRTTVIADGDSEVGMRMFEIASLSGNSPTRYSLLQHDCFGTPRVEGIHARAAPSVAYLNMVLIRDFDNQAHPFEYTAWQKIGSTYHGWFGTRGGNWVWVESYTHTVPLDRIWLFASNNLASTPGNGVAGIDFFRVYSGRHLL